MEQPKDEVEAIAERIIDREDEEEEEEEDIEEENEEDELEDGDFDDDDDESFEEDKFINERGITTFTTDFMRFWECWERVAFCIT